MQKRYAVKRRPDLSFKVNDKVLLSTAHEHTPLRAVGTWKLLMKSMMGPLPVVMVVNQVANEVKLPVGWRVHDMLHVRFFFFVC